MTDRETAQVNGWSVHEHAAGWLAKKGTEIHVQIEDQSQLRRNTLRKFLKPMFEELGFLTTRAGKEDAFAQKFVQRIGFEKTWEDGKFAFFMLTALPFERK